MEASVKQKLGIVLSLVGGVLLLGFNWGGPSIVVIGVVLVTVGLILALRKDSRGEESRWVHDNTQGDDD